MRTAVPKGKSFERFKYGERPHEIQLDLDPGVRETSVISVRPAWALQLPNHSYTAPLRFDAPGRDVLDPVRKKTHSGALRPDRLP